MSFEYVSFVKKILNNSFNLYLWDENNLKGSFINLCYETNARLCQRRMWGKGTGKVRHITDNEGPERK